MKKIQFVIVAAILGITQLAYSQASVSIGLKGGLNFSNLNSSSASGTYDSRTGYHAGAFVSIKVTKIAIQPELIFSKQGSDIKYSGQPTVESNFNYLNIPVMLKLYIVSGLNLQIGPQFGYLMSAKGADPTGVTSGSVDIKSSYKSSDLSVGMGAGFDIASLSIDARYNLGVSEINNVAGSSAAKNQVFQLSLGYKLFKLGK